MFEISGEIVVRIQVSRAMISKIKLYAIMLSITALACGLRLAFVRDVLLLQKISRTQTDINNSSEIK